ncbi:hypothetical protein [Roseateles sp. L2-2]|uniref:hypothetical protein n=1 Tax=Roseateles sp. L2-2 TaxID=3422597 RepID=UPI003D35DB5B
MLIVGFDARNGLAPQDASAQGGLHAIRLSADPAVWPRPSNIDEFLNRQVDEVVNPLTLSVRPEILVDRLRRLNSEAFVSVALSLSELCCEALIDRFGPGWFENLEAEKEAMSAGWKHCGFDVVDLRGLISGIFGVGSAFGRSVGGAWLTQQLNDSGLISTRAAAMEFSQVMGLHLQSHAPFVPVGVLTRSGDSFV